MDYNTIMIIHLSTNNINIINIHKMIFEGEDVKIEEESDKLIHKKPE